MSTENTESILAQWFRRVWNESDPSAIKDLSTPDMASHGLTETIRGPEAWRTEFYDIYCATFADVKVEVMDEVICGDKIFARLIATQTPRVTGSPVKMHGSCLVRVVDGKIAEAWDAWDFLSLMEGMRLLPSGSLALALTGRLQAHPVA